MENTTEKENKLIIIVWRWRNPTPGQLDPDPHWLEVDSYSDARWRVKGEPQRLLCRYDLAAHAPDAVAKIMETLQHYAPTHFIQVFLHTSHGYTQEHTRQVKDGLAKEYHRKIKFSLFGGSGHIYIGTNSVQGLLGTTGPFSARVSGKKIESVEQDAEGNWYIKKEHFDSIWNYYFYKFKKETFELKEDFIRVYIPILNAQNGEISFEAEESLRQRLSVFTFNSKKERTDAGSLTFPLYAPNDPEFADKVQIIYRDPEIQDLFAGLQEEITVFIQNPPRKKPSVQSIAALRDAFDAFLNALPENTYA